MKSLLEDIQADINDALKPLLDEIPSKPLIEFSHPDRPEHGDLSCNIAMKLAKPLKKAPRVIAAECVNLLQNHPGIQATFTEFQIAGPGFLNFFFADPFLFRIGHRILSEKGDYGRNTRQKDSKTLLEFVSANPTGPLTIAHARQAIVGDCLARILKFCGGEAQKEYYLNDRGVQIQILGESVFLRYLEARGHTVEFPIDAYQGDYISSLAKQVAEKYGDQLEQYSVKEGGKALASEAMEAILATIKQDLADFGVIFDQYFSETTLQEKGKISTTLQQLESQGHAYQKEGALWLASSQMGDDKDRVLVKSDGEFTYLASDIPYHQDKLARGFTHLVDMMGPDHHGYIPRLKASIQALGYKPDQLTVLIIQLVSLFRGKEQLSMSTRKGQFISLRELLDEVGSDAGRYFFAARKTDSHLDFDLELAKKQTPDNPVFYVQYAAARISSICRKAEAQGLHWPDKPWECFNLLSFGPEEKGLLKNLCRFPEVVADAARRLEPQTLPIYLEELASQFQKYYSSGKKIITEDSKITLQKCLLCLCIRQVLANGLNLLGIKTPERM